MSETFDANQYLLDRYEGEVLGVAFFGLLAELEENADWHLRWRLLERHERHVGSRLRQELEARELEAAPDPVKAQEGRKAAAAIWELPVESRVNAMIPALRRFVDDFREAADAAPPRFSEVAQLVLDHEVALLEFFEAMARDDAAGANAAIEDFLRTVGAPDEQPIPEGIALTPLDPAFRADPNPSFHLLRERAPVHRDRGFGNRVVLTRHDDVMRVVRDLEFWVDPRKSLPDDPVRMFISDAMAEGEPSMLFLDDPGHRRLRNFVSRSFTPRTIERTRPIIKEVARELVDAVEAGTSAEFDLMEALAAPLPAIAIARLLGVDTADQAKFKLWSVASSEAFFNPFAGDDLKRRGELASIALSDYFTAEVQNRRESHSDDLIGQMVAAEMEGDQLTVQEIITMCNLLLIAGNVTTTDLIGNGMRALLGNPDQHRRLREKPELIQNAVEEMLRFDPPVTSTGRIAPRDIEIDGIPIRQGESITLLLAAANRDPAIYPDPDRFDIERKDTHHQSFGGGAHLCLGAHLARIEAQEAIAAVVNRFPNLRDAGRAPVYKQTPGFRGLAEYWVFRD
jgi:cytochrome P450